MSDTIFAWWSVKSLLWVLWWCICVCETQNATDGTFCPKLPQIFTYGTHEAPLWSCLALVCNYHEENVAAAIVQNGYQVRTINFAAVSMMDEIRTPTLRSRRFPYDIREAYWDGTRISWRIYRKCKDLSNDTLLMKICTRFHLFSARSAVVEWQLLFFKYESR